MTNPVTKPTTQKLIFWFGAGISGASGMPLGMQLTEHWLEFLLPDGEYLPLYQQYNKVMDAIGRQGPRLEKVIDDAITTFGEACLAPLTFFAQCAANASHKAIAECRKCYLNS
ncbi:MAG: hypothetical protein ACI8WB_005516 [Phenylobacterium sp.]|jgi:hypothetical protein